MTSRLALAAALSALALGFAGCSQAETTNPPAAPAPAPTTQAETTTAPATPEATDDTAPADAGARNEAALRALATAAGAANGTAYEIDDEDDDDTWEVDVMVGERSIEVKVSGDGNSVLSQEDDDDADDDDRERLAKATVPLADAIETALTEVPGTFDDAELDTEDGQDVWKIKIDTAEDDDVEVYVSTTENRVIKTDR